MPRNSEMTHSGQLNRLTFKTGIHAYNGLTASFQ